MGHYSAAIFANRKDPTFPLNRAAAYLKLGKSVAGLVIPHRSGSIAELLIRRNEDAERDCSSTLALDPKNVKALFRRAQARIALNKLPEAQLGKF